MNRKRKINIHCSECGHKESRVMDHFAHGEDLRCPKCKTPMSRRIRINCMEKGCKRWVIVVGDPTFNNPNFHNEAIDGYIDLRNQGLVCDDHEAKYKKR